MTSQYTILSITSLRHDDVLQHHFSILCFVYNMCSHTSDFGMFLYILLYNCFIVVRNIFVCLYVWCSCGYLMFSCPTLCGKLSDIRLQLNVISI